MKLKGKVALVTGASRGIGRAVALRLAQEGADVVVNYHSNFQAANQVAGKIKNIGQRALVVKANVANGNEVNEMVNSALEKFGKINILVNNAGIELVGPFVDLREEDWDAMFNTNVKGCFLCCRAVAKHMIKQKGGKIINIASMLGKIGYESFAAYCATKFAVIGFTQSIALELAPYNINVNAVCPGSVDTDMLKKEFEDLAKQQGILVEEVRAKNISGIPLGRLEKPEDVAGLVAFLASDDSDYMTGQAINICGGVIMH